MLCRYHDDQTPDPFATVCEKLTPADKQVPGPFQSTTSFLDEVSACSVVKAFYDAVLRVVTHINCRHRDSQVAGKQSGTSSKVEQRVINDDGGGIDVGANIDVPIRPTKLRMNEQGETADIMSRVCIAHVMVSRA